MQDHTNQAWIFTDWEALKPKPGITFEAHCNKSPFHINDVKSALSGGFILKVINTDWQIMIYGQGPVKKSKARELILFIVNN